MEEFQLKEIKKLSVEEMRSAVIDMLNTDDTADKMAITCYNAWMSFMHKKNMRTHEDVKCAHLEHDKPNEFISQSPSSKEGDYTMKFKCAKCGTVFTSHNNIDNDLVTVIDEEVPNG